jgi:predicted RNase H-like HicB family nuclease
LVASLKDPIPKIHAFAALRDSVNGYVRGQVAAICLPRPQPAKPKDQVVYMITYTAKYLKIESGYMGQLVEWPEVLTEGRDLDECRAMLRDALQEMFAAYVQLGKEIPVGNALIEQLPIEMKHVGQTA